MFGEHSDYGNIGIKTALGMGRCVKLLVKLY